MAVNKELYKSSYSGNGGCVGVKLSDDGERVEVWDYKDLDKKSVLSTVTTESWAHFIQECKDGEFDLGEDE